MKTPAAVLVALLLASSTAVAAPRGKARKPATPPPAAQPAAPAVPSAVAAAPTTLQHGALHVEFGETTLGGQSHKGAITVVERPELAQHSLLKQRSHFRAELGDAVR